jgi:hypothetical protein
MFKSRKILPVDILRNMKTARLEKVITIFQHSRYLTILETLTSKIYDE